MAAATAILDRGHGKPAQHIDADHSRSTAHQISLMTPAERARDALELAERENAGLY